MCICIYIDTILIGFDTRYFPKKKIKQSYDPGLLSEFHLDIIFRPLSWELMDRI